MGLDILSLSNASWHNIVHPKIGGCAYIYTIQMSLQKSILCLNAQMLTQ